MLTGRGGRGLSCWARTLVLATDIRTSIADYTAPVVSIPSLGDGQADPVDLHGLQDVPETWHPAASSSPTTMATPIHTGRNLSRVESLPTTASSWPSTVVGTVMRGLRVSGGDGDGGELDRVEMAASWARAAGTSQ